MMKVKISKSKKFTVPNEPTTFDISLRDEKEEVKGTLTIDTIKKTMRVDLGKPLTDYTNDRVEHEQLAVLKEIFYCFCITECKRTKNKVSEHVEEYKFIDVNTSENRKSIIDYIMQYDQNEFNGYKRKEKIISCIKSDYDRIKEQKNFNRNIELGIMTNFSRREIEVYKKILCKYLKSKGINGKLYNVSDKYNSAFKLEFSTYPFDAFIAFEFVKDGV